MTTNVSYLFLLPLIPLCGALLNGVLGLRAQEKLGKWAVHSLAIAASASTFVLAIMSLRDVASAGGTLTQVLWPWISMGGAGARVSVNMGFAVDALTAVMLLVITGVGTLIHIFSVGYMRSEKPYWRYFAWLNLFMAMMLILVIGDSLLLMFVGWEGVGLASYLLIGYYYEDIDKAQAGMKAFLVNRVGDFAFIVGMAMLFWALGGAYTDAAGAQSYAMDPNANFTLSFRELAGLFADPAFVQAFMAKNLWGLPVVHLAPIFLFVGAMGKSAQIPLYVWLPDAMAGPTPVSALIHAATMVTAGVYMVVRLSFLFSLSSVAMTVVAVTGALTALFAATMGFFQTDIKKVLAYSTISQLGFMFLAAGVGAFTAAIFHLMTHAFFKACLFLGAGAVIAGMHHKQDMKDMGGLRSRMPVTFWTFFISTLAISGIPGLAGFFSKDEILWRTYDSANILVPGELLWVIAVIAAGCTAFYMFRLVYQTFLGEPRADEETLAHVHEEKVMSVPLAILATLALFGGYVGLPAWTHLPNLLGDWLAPVLETAQSNTQWKSELLHAGGDAASAVSFQAFHSHTGEIILMIVSVLVALGGIFLARKIYGKAYQSPEDEAQLFGAGVHRLIYDKYYIDEIYQARIVRPSLRVMAAISRFDNIVIDGLVNLMGTINRVVANVAGFFDLKLVDGLVHAIADLTANCAQTVRKIQTGRVQNYIFGAVAGTTLIIFATFLF